MNQQQQQPYHYHHVLIIDDIKIDILVLKEILTSFNYAEHISTFENPVAAYNFLKKCQVFPEIIFLDLKMPGISGFEFLKRFVNEFAHSTKFIIVSSSDDPEDIKASTSFTNVIHYFIKPISLADLSIIKNKKLEMR